jgi:hypothetical protein
METERGEIARICVLVNNSLTRQQHRLSETVLTAGASLCHLLLQCVQPAVRGVVPLPVSHADRCSGLKLPPCARGFRLDQGRAANLSGVCESPVTVTWIDLLFVVVSRFLPCRCNNLRRLHTRRAGVRESGNLLVLVVCCLLL